MRPNWDDYLMGMAFWCSIKSLDPHTKHGCVIVDEEHAVLSTGYNGPQRGADDSVVPLTRPEKYSWMLHAEENAFLLAARNGTCLKGAKLYVTGHPCDYCVSRIVQVGIQEVVYGPIEAKCLKWEIIEEKIKNSSVKFTSYNNLDFLKKYNYI